MKWQINRRKRIEENNRKKTKKKQKNLNEKKLSHPRSTIVDAKSHIHKIKPRH